ncbi:hypothetical protein C464_07020 [Halorubrum coriense DSM 10284]|uniref:Lipoprotein n=1 Tax=Halorubrum coriense DSM 10284 TaxID=1227466 RepID=M0EKX4_9EURY|nr:hypothetical protein [Halorubrum coriense]ELZ48431.1 hypothetical protein C464_07020 [Halorubrum coriense DSM 10284]
MTDITRRTTLYGIATGSAAALAGCTGAGDPGTDGSGTDGGDGGGGGSDGTNGDGTDGEVETAVKRVETALLREEWSRTERRGYCVVIAEEGDAEWLLAEASDPVRAFVEETDFEESVLCYLESVGPTTCHDEVAFGGVAVEDGTLVADATVRGPQDEEVACGEAITYPAALLRVTSDPLPEAARLSVTDGWGETGTVRNDD